MLNAPQMQVGGRPVRLPLTQFLATLEGRQLIDDQLLFAYEEKLWQGWKGQCVRVEDSQVKPAEVDNALDVDGSLEVITNRIAVNRRGLMRRVQKEREEKEHAAQLKEAEILRARKLRRDLGMEDPESIPIVDPTAEDAGPLDDLRSLRPRAAAGPGEDVGEEESGTGLILQGLAELGTGIKQLTMMLAERLPLPEQPAGEPEATDEVETEPDPGDEPGDPAIAATGGGLSEPGQSPFAGLDSCPDCNKPVPAGKHPERWIPAHRRAVHKKG